MKLYTKIIDGYVYIMPANKIVIIKDDMQIFNPTEEILFSDGWELYIPPVNELTEEEILQQEKENRINDIIEYDSSDSVNIFYVNDNPMWLDKATRAGLVGRLTAELKIGKNMTTLWYDTIKFELPTETAMDLLCILEIYASECYDMTQQHIANVKSFTDLDSLKAYDFTGGYPDVPKFNI